MIRSRITQPEEEQTLRESALVKALYLMFVMHSLSHSLIHLFSILCAYLCPGPGSGNVAISNTVIPHLMEHRQEQKPELNYLELHIERVLQREGYSLGDFLAKNLTLAEEVRC